MYYLRSRHFPPKHFKKQKFIRLNYISNTMTETIHQITWLTYKRLVYSVNLFYLLILIVTIKQISVDVFIDSMRRDIKMVLFFSLVHLWWLYVVITLNGCLTTTQSPYGIWLIDIWLIDIWLIEVAKKLLLIQNFPEIFV